MATGLRLAIPKSALSKALSLNIMSGMMSALTRRRVGDDAGVGWCVPTVRSFVFLFALGRVLRTLRDISGAIVTHRGAQHFGALSGELSIWRHIARDLRVLSRQVPVFTWFALTKPAFGA